MMLKRFFIVLILVTFTITAILLIPTDATAGNNFLQNTWNKYFLWLQDNWSYIALVISEIAAFLPTKTKGIIQAFLNAAAIIFKKNSTNNKNQKS